MFANTFKKFTKKVIICQFSVNSLHTHVFVQWGSTILLCLSLDLFHLQINGLDKLDKLIYKLSDGWTAHVS